MLLAPVLAFMCFDTICFVILECLIFFPSFLPPSHSPGKLPVTLQDPRWGTTSSRSLPSSSSAFLPQVQTKWTLLPLSILHRGLAHRPSLPSAHSEVPVSLVCFHTYLAPFRAWHLFTFVFSTVGSCQHPWVTAQCRSEAATRGLGKLTSGWVLGHSSVFSIQLRVSPQGHIEWLSQPHR